MKSILNISSKLVIKIVGFSVTENNRVFPATSMYPKRISVSYKILELNSLGLTFAYK